jgi:ribosomal protein S12 methylthiotransferase accessory factor
VAALSGIYEVIERDAFAITWQAQLPRPRIRPDTLPPKLRHLLARIERPGSRVVLFHLPMDHGVPVILSAMTSTVSDAPTLVVGAAAHLDPALAVQKSLEELAQIAAMAQRTKSRQPKFSPGSQWKNVVDPQSHAALYYDHTNAHLAGFLFDSSEYRSFTDIEGLSTGNPIRDLDLLVTTLHAFHYTVVVADVTTEDVRALGLCVLRAMIPGFHPLYMGYRFRALGGMRLREVPRTLGYAGMIRKTGDNPSPHPFS